MANGEEVSLDELVNPNLSVTLRGKRYPVAPLDGYAKQLTQGISAANSVDIMYEVAVRVLAPGLSREEVFGGKDVIGLTPQQISAVIDVAARHVKKVEATLPNDSGVQAAPETGTNEKNDSPESPRLTLSAS